MKKFKIVAIGKKDGFYNDREEFVGKVLEYHNLFHIGGGWYCAKGNVIPNPRGINPHCFCQIRLKEIKS